MLIAIEEPETAQHNTVTGPEHLTVPEVAVHGFPLQLIKA
jgi:hypothetical protein